MKKAKTIRVAFVIGGYPPEEHKRRADVALSYSSEEVQVGIVDVKASPYFYGMTPAEIQLVAPAFIESFKQAERQGYDTVVPLGTLELGVDGGKAAVDIPVVGPTEAALHEVNKRVYDEMSIKKLISPYGLTETHIGGTASALDDPLELRMTTVGRPMPGVEIGIRRPGGQEFVPEGEPGEVCFKGWCITKGYFDDSEKTAKALGADGWFRTGDLRVIGKDGCVRLIGRIKDMIRVGGENVAAAEVETVLLRHDAVKQAVAVGMADPRLAEVVTAFIELKTNKQATEAEIIDYCRRHLASFKIPRRVVFVTDWPMTGAGKIQRFVLKESLAEARPGEPS